MNDDNDSSQSTDEEVDLEEGEILDSGAEEEEEKKDLTNSSLQEALGKNFLKSIEQLVSQAKTDVSPPNPVTKSLSPHNSPVKMKKRSSKYLDHDQFENNSDQEDGWYSPSRKRKSKFDAKPIDYRMELEAYIGTPPSSPDRKHRDKKKRRSSKKSKKSGKGKKIIKRKDNKGMRVSQYIKDAMKHKICKFFKEGKCAKGADCGFSHANPQPYKKKELCKFYLSGHCNKGKDCIYMHNEFPCKFYHTGSECYAKDACRFSHEPLNDEMKRVLADYLKIHHGDDDYDRKRRRSPTPEPRPPSKRTCLLGSPPRHIREAEETKRWQEEMHIQQHNHPGFKIHISPSRDNETPPPFVKPNFYQDTMPSTPPQKRRMNSEPMNGPSNFPPPSSTAGGFPMSHESAEPFREVSPDRYPYDDDYQEMDPMNIKQESPEFSWTNMRGMDHNLPPIKNEMESFVDPAQQDLDFTSDVKFDETTQFSEMESSIDCNLSPPSNNAVSQPTINKDNEEESSDQGNIKTEDKTIDESSSVPDPVTPTIFIPSHLPKKQQELFKRIHLHQQKNVTTPASDVSNSPTSGDASEPQIKEAEEEEKPAEQIAESLWYSSEDDDDDDTVEPLTDVLKKLQKEPPPAKVESKPAANIMAMLNKIQQNALDKNKGGSETKQGDFFKSLLLGNISTPTESLKPSILDVPTSGPKRRTLLPDPQIGTVKKELPLVIPKDPRLKNRDPRTLSSSGNNSLSLPKVNVTEQNISQVSSFLPTTLLNLTVKTEPAKEDVPYRLRGIATKPPNYASYISASQSNPNLLKDPRLRKHLGLGQNGIENKEADLKIAPKNAPPIPKLLLKYDKPDSLNINIFETNSTQKPVTENAQDPTSHRPKLIDPRMRRRESQNSSGSNTPPHLTIVENSAPPSNPLKIAPTLEKEVKAWLPPVLEKNWTPPILEQQSWIASPKQEDDTPTIRHEIDIDQTLIKPEINIVSIKQEVDSDVEDDYYPMRLEIDESPPSSSINEASTVIPKKAKPIPASHLPRAIADPRMAKLHTPLDSRRTRAAASESSKKIAVDLKKTILNSSNENSSDSSRMSPIDPILLNSENLKTVKSIPKKNQSSERSEEKKKTVHRNRKSSMDYASPLNSCDDSNSNKSLNYNSYNKRPTRTASSKSVTDSSVSNILTNLVVSETTADFLSDNSNLECDNSNDVNLKDMFKTIDPTASPFC